MQNIETQDESIKLPHFVMSGAAGLFADTYSQCMEPPKEFFYFSYLTSLGSLLSDRLTLNAGNSPQPRFYTILVGSSADDRKSTAGNMTIKFFREAIKGGVNVCLGCGSAEGLIKQIEKAEGNKLLLFVDEFKSLISKTKIDGSVLLPALTSLYEENSYESHTKTTSIVLEKAYLSILSCTTVDSFEEIWSSSLSNIGLDNRLLLVSGESQRRFSIPKKVPADKKSTLKKQLADIVSVVGSFKELDIDSQAFEIYDDWYMSLERSIYTKRLDTLALRLMLVLAVNDLKTEVDSETVLKTIEICNWQLSLRKELMPLDGDNATARMEQKIRRALNKGSLTNRNLSRKINASRAGVWFFDTALKNLIKVNEVSFSKTTNEFSLVPEHKVSSKVSSG